MTRRLHIVLVLALVCGRAAAAQSDSTTRPAALPDSACTYRRCALVMMPVWNGLSVVRPSDDNRVANLNFFFPRDISRAIGGSDPTRLGADSALAHARRAVGLRQTAALMTDVGAVAIAIASLRALKERRIRTTDRVVGGLGLASVLVSVPIQFAADGELSIAVWWHNLRFTP